MEFVNHPSYYGGAENPYEVIKVIEAWGLDNNFDLATVIKFSFCDFSKQYPITLF